MNRPIILDLFDAYKENLTYTGNNQANKDVMLCPLCLSEITKKDILENIVPLEHIIPQHATVDKAQKTKYTKIGVKNVRSGLTITCPDCNRKKGKELDWFVRNLITPGEKREEDYCYRSGVAILIYAYLFAFAVLGYDYILNQELDEIRLQFSDPDQRHTSLLDYALVNLQGPAQPIVCNEWGYPFVMGGFRNGFLEVYFWRFSALLPSISHVSKPVIIPESIKKLVTV